MMDRTVLLLLLVSFSLHFSSAKQTITSTYDSVQAKVESDPAENVRKDAIDYENLLRKYLEKRYFEKLHKNQEITDDAVEKRFVYNGKRVNAKKHETTDDALEKRFVYNGKRANAKKHETTDDALEKRFVYNGKRANAKKHETTDDALEKRFVYNGKRANAKKNDEGKQSHSGAAEKHEDSNYDRIESIIANLLKSYDAR